MADSLYLEDYNLFGDNSSPINDIPTDSYTVPLNNGTQPKRVNYPPPPDDRMQLPLPIQEHIQSIVSLCNVDSLEGQVYVAKQALTGLREAIPFYTRNYSEEVHVSILNDIYMNLFGIKIIVFWQYLSSTDRTVNIAGEFLLQHRLMYNLQDGAGPEYLRFDWARDLYTGLFCLTYGYAPPKSLANKLENK